MCDHAPAANPRMTHEDGSWDCVKCGRPQPACPVVPRDLTGERRWTEQAAATVGANVDKLNAFAEGRSGPDPVRNLDARNFGREVTEELADARNYLCWWNEQICRNDRNDELSGEIIQAITGCLASVARAYELADRARMLTREWAGVTQ